MSRKISSKRKSRFSPWGAGFQVALVMLLLAGWLGYRFSADQRQVFLPGSTSDGHHVLEEACGSCHGGFEAVVNDSCTSCHQSELAEDTHPVATFLDPRWAEDLELLDARLCVTCHREHEVADLGVTVEAQHCFPCHDDVVEKRQTHQDLTPGSCANAGCHNYHDNRALSPAFLERRLGQPALLPGWSLPQRRAVAAAHEPPGKPLDEWPGNDNGGDNPGEVRRIRELWSASGHAVAGVGCLDCHQDGAFELSPSMKVCGGCHEGEQSTFFAGKHGVRTSLDLDPLTPAMARRPMKPAGPLQPEAVSCGACHDVHSVDTRQAATEACMGCHDDEHSRSFQDSPHARLSDGHGGARPGEQEVTCATCHLPRQIEYRGRETHIQVNHNNSFTLAPLDRMAALVCNHCHGFELSLTSVLDADLSRANYPAAPENRLETFSMMASQASGP